jgi:hypothetical protein
VTPKLKPCPALLHPAETTARKQSCSGARKNGLDKHLHMAVTFPSSLYGGVHNSALRFTHTTYQAAGCG